MLERFIKQIIPSSLIDLCFRGAIVLSLSLPTSHAGLFDGDTGFLDVEDAFQVLVNRSEDSLGFNWTMEPEYYLYQHQFTLVVRNQEKAVYLPLTFEPGQAKFDDHFQKDLTVYYGQTRTSSAHPDLTPPYELIVGSQGCADAGLCYPPRKQYFLVNSDGVIQETNTPNFDTPVPDRPSIEANKTESNKTKAVAETSSGASHPFVLFTVILGALFGGLILNLMPCVFPVLSLKALSFTSSGLSPHGQHLHGWAYTAGVVLSFLIAAIAILGARSAGESLGWGFQLQQPEFVALMIYLFFVMALSLSGAVHLGGSWMGLGQSLTSGHDLKSSFFTGVLAALVASPCTAPFMATALGIAMTQPTLIALVIFASLGFGLALPFLLLSYSPKLAQMLPQPGPWMDTLKQLLAYPLYLTCVWLLWVLGNQSSSEGAALIVLGATVLSFGLWLLQLRVNSKTGHTLLRGTAFASIILALLLAFQVGDDSTKDNDQWQVYSAEKLASLRDNKQAVFINLTADWCITCKVNERVALNKDKVLKFAQEQKITLLKGDWTNSDPKISALLNQYGRNGVPLYLMYPRDNTLEPEILPQILTAGTVLNAMEAATKEP